MSTTRRPFFKFPHWQDMPGLERAPFTETVHDRENRLRRMGFEPPFPPRYTYAETEKWRHRGQNVGTVIDLHAIDKFRESLPPHRVGWFTSLSLEDQNRLAEGYVLNEEANYDMHREEERQGVNPGELLVMTKQGGLV